MTFAQAIKENRAASWSISWRDLTEIPDSVHFLHSKVLIMDCRYSAIRQGYQYEGFSPLFDVVPDGHVPPHLILQKTRISLGISNDDVMLEFGQ